jgi:hypothetical protein
MPVATTCDGGTRLAYRVLQGGQERVQTEQGNAVYDADDCIGVVVNGVCHGTINPSIQPVAHCYGSMINDQCTGPMY